MCSLCTRREGDERVPEYASSVPSSPKEKKHADTHLPLIRHFFSDSTEEASSLSATAWSTPTTTSALFVRRLRIGKEPASGPTRRAAHYQYVTRGRTEGGRERCARGPLHITRQPE
jgi:hypothetical protein